MSEHRTLNRCAQGSGLLIVGHKGSTPALQDLIGGYVQLMFDRLATSIPLFRRARSRRSPLLPEVPTVAELGYPQLEGILCMGLWDSPDLRAALQAWIRAAPKALTQPAPRERLTDVGFALGQARTLEQLSTSLESDYDRVGSVPRSIGSKPE